MKYCSKNGRRSASSSPFLSTFLCFDLLRPFLLEVDSFLLSPTGWPKQILVFKAVA